MPPKTWREKLGALQPVAWFFSIIRNVSTTAWTVVASALVSAVWAAWAWATQYGYLPVATFALVAFTCTILLVNGLISLRTRRRPLKESMEFDYSYGLALDGVHLGRDEGNPEAYLQVGICLRNATDAPLRYYLESMNVVIGDRTIPAPHFGNREAVIPRGGTSIYFYPSFSKAAIDSLEPRCGGRVEYSIKYGHPEAGYVRLSRKALTVSYRLDHQLAAVYLLQNESDEALRLMAKNH